MRRSKDKVFSSITMPFKTKFQRKGGEVYASQEGPLSKVAEREGAAAEAGQRVFDGGYMLQHQATPDALFHGTDNVLINLRGTNSSFAAQTQDQRQGRNQGAGTLSRYLTTQGQYHVLQDTVKLTDQQPYDEGFKPKLKYQSSDTMISNQREGTKETTIIFKYDKERLVQTKLDQSLTVSCSFTYHRP